VFSSSQSTRDILLRAILLCRSLGAQLTWIQSPLPYDFPHGEGARPNDTRRRSPSLISRSRRNMQWCSQSRVSCTIAPPPPWPPYGFSSIVTVALANATSTSASTNEPASTYVSIFPFRVSWSLSSLVVSVDPRGAATTLAT
jgi:hypothetical protein